MSEIIEEIKASNPEIDPDLLDVLKTYYSEEQLQEIKESIIYNAGEKSIKWKDESGDSLKIVYENGQIRKMKLVDKSDSADDHDKKLKISERGDTIKAKEVIKYIDGSKETTKISVNEEDDEFTYSNKVSERGSQGSGFSERNYKKIKKTKVEAHGENVNISRTVSEYGVAIKNPIANMYYDRKKDEVQIENEKIVERTSSSTYAGVGALGGFAGQKKEQTNYHDDGSSETNSGSIGISVGRTSGGFSTTHGHQIKDKNGNVVESSSSNFDFSGGVLSGININASKDVIKSDEEKHTSLSIDTNPLLGKVEVKGEKEKIIKDEDGSYTTSKSCSLNIGTGGFSKLNLGVSAQQSSCTIRKDANGKVISENKEISLISLKTTKIGYEYSILEDDGTNHKSSDEARMIGGRKLFQWRKSSENTKKDEPIANEQKTERNDVHTPVGVQENINHAENSDTRNENVADTEINSGSNNVSINTDNVRIISSNDAQQQNVVGKENSVQTYSRNYSSAEIINEVDENGNTHQYTIVDGKKHGPEIITDGNGALSDIKLYYNDDEMQINENDCIDIKKIENENGSLCFTTYNGKPFGSAIHTDNAGNISAEIYDLGGIPIKANKSAKLTITQVENCSSDNVNSQKTQDNEYSEISKQKTKEQMLTDSENAHKKMSKITSHDIGKEKTPSKSNTNQPPSAQINSAMRIARLSGIRR